MGMGGGGSLEHDPDVIVLDIGTGSIKVGWGGEDAPRVVVPTLLLDHQGQAMPAAAAMSMDQHHAERNEYAVGHAALQVRRIADRRASAAEMSGGVGLCSYCRSVRCG